MCIRDRYQRRVRELDQQCQGAEVNARASNAPAVTTVSAALVTPGAIHAPHSRPRQLRPSLRVAKSVRTRQQRVRTLSLIHISEPTRLLSISYAVFCLKKKKKKTTSN
eukprot:TRINITY_DN2240_c0_g1_i7.p1 TRINITY_DN2240_c0_g1~~TRINITY_DN2240_c0_g1_i7.p1  ORF type:complete len:108 (-),score=33.47 TRINITY_DN2240_c0_g1_i7:38-361(-)